MVDTLVHNTVLLSPSLDDSPHTGMDFHESHRPSSRSRLSQTFHRDTGPNSSPPRRPPRRSNELDDRVERDYDPWSSNSRADSNYDSWRSTAERRYESSPQRRHDHDHHHNDWFNEGEQAYQRRARGRRSISPPTRPYRPLTPSARDQARQTTLIPSIPPSSPVTAHTVTYNGVQDVPTAPTAILKARREPHIFISSTTLPCDQDTAPLLFGHVQDYGPTRVLVDDAGYYILFEDSKTGCRNLHTCYDEQNMRVFLGTHVLLMVKRAIGRPNPEPSSLDTPDADGSLRTKEAFRQSDVQTATTMAAAASDKASASGGAPRSIPTSLAGPIAALGSASSLIIPKVTGSNGQQIHNYIPAISREHTAGLSAHPHSLKTFIVPSTSLPATEGILLGRDLDETSSVGGKTTLSNVSASHGKKCHVCKKSTDLERMVQCQECPRRYHRQCHKWYSTPVGVDEKKTWCCYRCVKKSEPEGSTGGSEVTMRVAPLQCQPLSKHDKRLATASSAEDPDSGLGKKQELQRTGLEAGTGQRFTAVRPQETDDVGGSVPPRSLAPNWNKSIARAELKQGASVQKERLMKPGRRSSVEDAIIEDLLLDGALDIMETSSTGDQVQPRYSAPGSRPSFKRIKLSKSNTPRSTLTASDSEFPQQMSPGSGTTTLHQSETGSRPNGRSAIEPHARPHVSNRAADQSSHHAEQPLENISTSAAPDALTALHDSNSIQNLDAPTVVPNLAKDIASRPVRLSNGLVSHPKEKTVSTKPKAMRNRVIFSPCAECGIALPPRHSSKFCTTCEAGITASAGADDLDPQAVDDEVEQQPQMTRTQGMEQTIHHRNRLQKGLLSRSRDQPPQEPEMSVSGVANTEEHQLVLQEKQTTAVNPFNKDLQISVDSVSSDEVNSVREHIETATSESESSATAPSEESAQAAQVRPKCGDSTKHTVIPWREICLMAMSAAPNYCVSWHGVCRWLEENIPRHIQGKDSWKKSVAATLATPGPDKLWARTVAKDDSSAQYTLRKELRGKVVQWDSVLEQPVLPPLLRQLPDNPPVETVNHPLLPVKDKAPSLPMSAIADDLTAHQGSRQVPSWTSPPASRGNRKGVGVPNDARATLTSAQVRVPSPQASDHDALSTDIHMPDAPALATEGPPPVNNADVLQRQDEASSDDEPIRRGPKRRKVVAGPVPKAAVGTSLLQDPRMKQNSVRKDRLIKRCTKLKWNMENPYLKAILTGSTDGICNFTHFVKAASASYSQDYIMLNLSRYVLFRIANGTAHSAKTLSRCNMDEEIVLSAFRVQEGQTLSRHAQQQWDGFARAGDHSFRASGEPISREDIEAAEARFDSAIRVVEDHTLFAFDRDDPHLPKMPLSHAEIVQSRSRIADEPMTPVATDIDVPDDLGTVHTNTRLTGPPSAATPESVATNQITSSGQKGSNIGSTVPEKAAYTSQLPLDGKPVTETTKGAASAAKGTVTQLAPSQPDQPRQKKWSEEEWQKALTMRNHGQTQSNIAKALGRSARSVEGKFCNASVTSDTRVPSTKLTKECWREAAELPIQAKGTSIQDLIKRQAHDIQYSARRFFEEYPEYSIDAKDNHAARQERIASRPSRKQLFQKSAVYSLLADDKDEMSKLQKLARGPARSFEGRGRERHSQTPMTPRKSNFNPLLVGTDVEGETVFDTLDEFLDLPEKPLAITCKIGMGKDSQLAYRDGTMNADGELPRARVVYKVGPVIN